MQVTTPGADALRRTLLEKLSARSGDIDFGALVAQVAAESGQPTDEVAEALRRLIDLGHVIVTFDWALVAAAE